MDKKRQSEKAKAFAEYWKDKGYEKGESQSFWLSLLRDVLGVEEPEKLIKFEDKVMLDHTSFIDGIIESTHVLIEQKDSSKNLRKAIRQSDGSLLSPFQQAKRYSANLPYSKRPRYIITCNFWSFLIYDMENPQGEPEELLLKNLSKEYYRLNFIVNAEDKHIKREEDISIKAGELVGRLYNALLNQYIKPDSINSLKSLNMLCVRLVFCLYAEDAGIFGKRDMFHDYLQSIPKNKVRNLNQPLQYIIEMAISVGVAFVISFMIYKDKEPVVKTAATETTVEKTEETENVVEAENVSAEEITSPVNGNVVATAEVADETFASEMLGTTVAVEPTDGKIVAPCDGEVMNIFDTGHAVCIATEAGAELLIHIGIDTVSMDGKGFVKKVADGAKVRKGDVLIEADLDAIKAAGHPATTMMILTNADDFSKVEKTAAGTVTTADLVMKIEK